MSKTVFDEIRNSILGGEFDDAIDPASAARTAANVACANGEITADEESKLMSVIAQRASAADSTWPKPMYAKNRWEL